MKKAIICALVVLVSLCAYAQKWDTISAANVSCVINACVYVDISQNEGYAAIQVTGTFSQTLQFEATVDGTTFVSVGSTTAPGLWQLNVNGYRQLRVRASAVASGLATVKIVKSKSDTIDAAYPGVSSNGSGLKVAGSVEVGTTVTTPLGAPSSSAAVSGAVYLPNSSKAGAIAYGSGAPSGTPNTDFYVDYATGLIWLNAGGMWVRQGTADYYVDWTNGNDSTGDGRTPATAYKTLKKLSDLSVPSNSQVLWKAADGSWIPAPPWTGIQGLYDFSTGSGTTLIDKSGNGKDGTFGATTAAPSWVASGVSFDGGDTITVAINSLTARTFAALMTFNPVSVEVSLGTSDNSVYQGFISGYHTSDNFSGQKTIIGDLYTGTPTLLVNSADTGKLMQWENGIKGTITPSGAPATVNLSSIGSRNGALGMHGIYHALAVYNRAISDAEYTQLHHWMALAEQKLNRGVTVPPFLLTPEGEVVFEGDSLTSGTGATVRANNYPSQTLTSLGVFNGANYGISGQKATDLTASLLASTVTSKINSSYRKQVAVLWIGTNDLYADADATTTYNAIVTAAGIIKAAGFKVVILTIIPRQQTGTPAGFEAKRVLVNNNIKANWSTFSDALANVGDAANLQDPTNTTYFNADKTHLTDAGYTVVSGIVATAVRSLF